MNKGSTVFLVTSLVIIIVGIGIYFEASAFQKKCKLTSGVVTSRNVSYYFVTYTTNDGVVRTYKANQPGKHRYYEGAKFKVFYVADSPDKVRLHDGRIGGRITFISGVFLLALTIYSTRKEKAKKKLSDESKASGRKVEAEITSVETDFTITILEKHPWVIRCRWTDPITGKEYKHNIDQIWQDPTPYLNGRKTIDVYIDRINPESYYLDMEFLAAIKAY